jgi:hypothetical protein
LTGYLGVIAEIEISERLAVGVIDTAPARLTSPPPRTMAKPAIGEGAVTNPAIAIITIVVIGIAALALLWWYVPKWQLNSLKPEIPPSNPKERADVEDNFRKTFGQALGGAAVLIGAGFALFQFLQQQQAAHDLLITNQVSKGFEQLAGHEIAMRLGGIYALEGVMNDKTSPQYQQPVLEALCAFVRENTIGKTVPDKPTTDVQALMVIKPATDIQAALTVIGRRAVGPDGDLTAKDYLDLEHVSIPGANLFRADLSIANLRDTNLNVANLGDADLSYANLIYADLSHANLINADLSHAALNGANLSYAPLNGANLSGASLIGADLSVAQNLTQTQLDKACGDANTKLPDGLTLKPCQMSDQSKVP